MKCSKCGYDYPARETKCPYCGEPNKLGMEWEKEEDETRKETLLTKAKVLHSMPLYVANKIMNIILLLAVVLLVVLFLVFFILGYVDEKHTEHQKRSASVEEAEEIFKTGDNAALDAYLHEYEVYAEDGYEKYTERVDIYDRYSHFIEDVMDLREKSDWESDKTPRAYEVEDILCYAHEILLQDDYRISEIEFQENQKYFSEIQQNTIATLMGTLEMTEEEVNEFVKCDRYYDEEETFVKIIFERKRWEYEEN